ncbi:MAG: ATP-binding protein [Acetobacter aceti]|uniref:AAA+ ATPase domain-containing protein n=1 Tax=Acetobacter aceti TaxID=435 RepID=A0A1U9KHC0_ACEAC|nr:ATP-binding protein [Acetobacter aceti]AQS85137.1 hypothetical protein A0U92_10485 [Acetobacter aceti]
MVKVVAPSGWGEIIPPNPRAEKVGEAFLKGSLNWLMFEGPPGSGKTSAADALLLSRYTDLHETPSDIIYLNAAVNRSEDGVRSAIEGARCFGQNSSGKKFLILDEVDCLSSTAASTLKGKLDGLGEDTPVILTTNHLSKLDKALVSRFGSSNCFVLAEEVESHCDCLLIDTETIRHKQLRSSYARELHT